MKSEIKGMRFSDDLEFSRHPKIRMKLGSFYNDLFNRMGLMIHDVSEPDYEASPEGQEMQTCGVDITLHNGIKVWISEKFRRYNGKIPMVFLEVHHDIRKDQYGWTQFSKADYIVWVFWDKDKDDFSYGGALDSVFMFDGFELMKWFRRLRHEGDTLIDKDGTMFPIEKNLPTHRRDGSIRNVGSYIKLPVNHPKISQFQVDLLNPKPIPKLRQTQDATLRDYF